MFACLVGIFLECVFPMRNLIAAGMILWRFYANGLWLFSVSIKGYGCYKV
jgi:hypothetical protein